ncbi:hypothetical protein HanPSC8_Chr06g0263581 [Helianthus annuus]|nr:hypothetical protein HanPSC8_Chr06g0263581 [Helianthus annuus]
MSGGGYSIPFMSGVRFSSTVECSVRVKSSQQLGQQSNLVKPSQSQV